MDINIMCSKLTSLSQLSPNLTLEKVQTSWVFFTLVNSRGKFQLIKPIYLHLYYLTDRRAYIKYIILLVMNT